MVKIISVVGQKGGVGKSTISRLLAVEAVNSDLKAAIVDLDPGQGTSTKWRLKRDRSEVDPEVEVFKVRTVEAAQRHADGMDLLVLDGPAFADKTTLQMAKIADLVILPTGYSSDDMEPQVEAAYELEENKIDPDLIQIVFCRAKGSGEEDRQARLYMKKAGLSVAKGQLRELPSIRQAQNTGRSASETGFPTVDAEGKALAAELMGLVPGLTITKGRAA